jgi:transcriptional regulator with XRE-family HTH domain
MRFCGLLSAMGASGLRAARLRAGLDQSTLARIAGVDRTAVSHAERGDRIPTFGVARRLAVALGCTPADLWPSAFAPSGADPLARALRRARVLSQAEVAAAAGVTLYAVRRAEAGCHVPPAHAKALATFYGVDALSLQPPLVLGAAA